VEGGDPFAGLPFLIGIRPGLGGGGFGVSVGGRRVLRLANVHGGACHKHSKQEGGWKNGFDGIPFEAVTAGLFKQHCD